MIKLGELVKSNRHSNLSILKMDIANHDSIVDFMVAESFDYVVNLTQAGVSPQHRKPKSLYTQ